MKNTILLILSFIGVPLIVNAQCTPTATSTYTTINCSVQKSGNTITLRAVPVGTFTAFTDNIYIEITVPSGVSLTGTGSTIGTLALPTKTQTGGTMTLDNVASNNCFTWTAGTPVTIATFTYTGSTPSQSASFPTFYFELAGVNKGGACPSISLPLELLSLEVQSNGKISQLSWSTASEINVEGFNIERSANSKTFEKVGFVKSVGTSRGTYTFTDEVPLSGVNYYRLKMMNTDGSFTYSPVRSVVLAESKTTGLSVSPNPAKDAVFVKLNAKEAKTMTLELVDIAGKVLLTEKKKVEVGFNQLSLNLSGYPAGLYFLKVEGVAHRVVVTE